jgi:DNA-binding IclR family transcriptional regulator
VNQSLQKAAQILEILMKGPTPVALTEFARALNIPKSTMSRFLSTLESLGFVMREKEGGKFYLGLRLFELGCKAIDDVGLRKTAIPEMEKLRDKINENILLTVSEGTRITYLDKIESQQAVVTRETIGSTAPAYCVSSGKAMIAFDEERLEQVIKEGLKSFTPMTIVDPNKLRKECEKIRKRGYAINRGEYRTGVTGIAAPIFNANGTLVGAISTAAPAERMNKRRWHEHVRAVTESANAISRNLGFSNKEDWKINSRSK